MCLMIIRKSGKQVNLGLFIAIFPLFIRFNDWKFLETFHKLSLSVLGDIFVKKGKSLMVIQSKKTAKSRYFFLSGMFSFHSLVLLLFPFVKLNGVSQSISIEYKMVPGLI